MLTRIEVDGFKNLLGFSAEFGPFTCIAGQNAVGKSNLFDAIEFLSLLAEHSLEDAADKVRETTGSMESSRRLFWTDGEVRADTISIAVEMVVPNHVFDKLGRLACPDVVCLRYEIKLRHDKGLRLVGERLLARGGTVAQHLRFPHPRGFAESYESVKAEPLQPSSIFDIEAGVLPGPSQAVFEPTRSTHTVLSQYTTADHPVLLAANLELASWRKLALDPAALRKPDKLDAHVDFSTRGDHLPAQFRRLTQPRHARDMTPLDEEEVSARLAAELRSVAGFRKIWIHDDHYTGLMTLKAQLRNGEEVTARELSDGTLRFLALAILEMSPQPGLYCIEEPENSLHPSQFTRLFQLFKRLAVDPFNDDFTADDRDPEEERPVLRQVIVNTHSSELVGEVFRHAREDLLMATTAFVSRPDGRPARVLHLNPVRGTWRCHDGVRGVMLPVVDYVGAAALGASAASAAEDG